MSKPRAVMEPIKSDHAYTIPNASAPFILVKPQCMLVEKLNWYLLACRLARSLKARSPRQQMRKVQVGVQDGYKHKIMAKTYQVTNIAQSNWKTIDYQLSVLIHTRVIVLIQQWFKRVFLLLI